MLALRWWPYFTLALLSLGATILSAMATEMGELFDVNSFKQSKLTHKDLIPIAYGWVLKNGSCGVAFKELNTMASNGEYPDVIGFGSWANSVLIEVKVSRNDFLSDKKKHFRVHPEKGMGRHRYYCCPTGMIKIAELPVGWGLIYVSESGKAICVYNPYKRYLVGNTWQKGHEGFAPNRHAEMGLMYSALRRLHIKGHIDSIYDKKYEYNHKEV